MIRLFISVELPDEIKKKVAELIGELEQTGAAVKWVEAEKLHLTLKFLGWIDESKLDEVISLTEKCVAGKGSFRVRFEGLGIFSRVIWVGACEGAEKLAELAKSLEEVFSREGYRREEREFNCHVTIGRIKERKGVDKLKEKMESFKDAKFGEALIGSIYIMKSTLTPKGPIYEKIKGVKL